MFAPPTIRLALVTSSTAHRHQARKGGTTPYIVHPVGVMLILAEYTHDEATLAAALLHDVLEDCPDVYSEDQMQRDFGDDITAIVKAVTKNETIRDWRERNEDYLATLKASGNPKAVMVSAADKINNLVDVLADYAAVGDQLWERFHAGKTDQLWWYQAACDVIAEALPGHALTLKLMGLVGELNKI